MIPAQRGALLSPSLRSSSRLGHKLPFKQQRSRSAPLARARDAGDAPSSTPESALSSLDKLLGGLSTPAAPQQQQVAASTAAGAERQQRAQHDAPPAVSSFDGGALVFREPPLSTTDLTGLKEPRTRPDISTAMYYLYLLVYASTYAAELIDGGEAAEVLRANLANDHAAVAAGDALRLFTSAFVTTSVQQLGITLLCLFTVGSELESLLGSGFFWALMCLSVVAGGLADAALSPQLITDGPAPIVAGLVSALLAFHVKNILVESQLQQVRRMRDAVFDPTAAGADAPPPSVARKTLQAMVEDLAGPPPRLQPDMAGADGGSAASKRGSSGGGGGGGADEAPVLEETRIEVIDGLWAPTVMLPREAKAFVTLAGMATASVSAVRDVAVSGDYTAVVASFVFGGALGYLLAPRWRVGYELAIKEGEEVSADSGGLGGGGWQGAAWPGAGGGPSVSSLDGSGGEYWRPKLVDSVPLRARANATIGAAALLYASLGLWLLSQGDFI